jgi:hypothetical protein
MIQRESSGSHGSFARSVLALGLLDEDELSALFASKTVYRQVAKDILQEMDLGVISIAPTHILAWLEVLPLVAREGALTVAMVDPTDQDAINQMAFFTGLRIKPVIATQSEILRGLREIGATIDVGESRFETFLKTHGRMSRTNQVNRPAATKRKHEVEDDVSIPEMTFEDDHFESTSAPAKKGASASDDVLMGSTAPVVAAPIAMEAAVPAPAANAVAAMESEPAGADLGDPDLAALAPDEPVSDTSMELDIDLPPELEDEAVSAEAMEEPDPLEANAPPAAAKPAAKPAAASLSGDDDDIDLSSLEADLDFDLDDSLSEADRPKASAPVLKAPAPAAASPVTASSVDDMDVDLSVDLTGGLGSLGGAGELPGGIDDEIKIQPAMDAVDDPNADLLVGLNDDDDSGPSLEGASDELTLSGDDLALGDMDLAGGIDASEINAAAVDSAGALSLDSALADAAPADDFELATPALDDLELAKPADDLDIAVAADNAELTDIKLDPSLPVTAATDELDAIGAESFTDDLATDPGLVDLSLGGDLEEPGFDAGLSTGAGEPDLDLGTLETEMANDASPSIGDLSELGDIADLPPQGGTPAPAASMGQTESTELAGAAHAGIAILNRALIQVQMAANAAKALSRVADVAGKVGIDSGSVVTLKGGKLIPGIMWHKSGGKLGHITDVPAGLDAVLVQSFAAKDGSGQAWVSIDQALGASGAAVKKAWPDAAQAPNMALVRKQGDAIILSIASFTGASDHDGLRQSFGDVIRAAGPKLGE